MSKSKSFSIKFIGLKDGKHSFQFPLSKSFFESFNYSDFNSADIIIQLGLLDDDKNSLLKENQNFIKLCLNENLSSEITLQPLKRFEIDLKKIVDSSGYDPWFVREIYELVEYEKVLKNKKAQTNKRQ